MSSMSAKPTPMKSSPTPAPSSKKTGKTASASKGHGTGRKS